MAPQIQHRIEHQLARHVVGHLATAINAMERQGWRLRIKAQVGLAGAAAQGVAGFLFHKQHGVRAGGIGQEPLLQLPLPGPGPGEGHGPAGFKKNCAAVGSHGFVSLLWLQTPPGPSPNRLNGTP
jgi:hypothetical protein